MRIASFLVPMALAAAPMTCQQPESSVPPDPGSPPPSDSPPPPASDAGASPRAPDARPPQEPLPGPYGLDDRVCFALAERCDEACDGELFQTLGELDGRLEAAVLRDLDRCFVPLVCEEYRACVDAWLATATATATASKRR